ncbi:hypothetical protein J6590_058661 [Homalodisca vitripennis]|uniref:Uncharacterized protein n=1 Tax=Homalodisca liturata TaxID=320908 RepID=A0A1B6IUZ2_9HEMI|nr:hypothetical protein J6590_058661 [Homalodisca vitripennis]
MVVLGIVFLAKLCFGTEMTAEMNTSMRAEVHEKLHKGTPNLLLTLGDTLKDSLLHPTPDRNHGEQTLRGLYDYYHNLEDVYQMMKGTEEVEKRLGMKLFQMLVEAGGPPHLDIEFDIEDAMEKFEWNNKAVYSVRQVIDDTEDLWEKIQMESEKLDKFQR